MSSSSNITSIIMIVTAVLTIASMWRLFSKAGEAGWKALVPIYNALVLLKIVGRPGWWLLLMLVPIVNLYPAIVLCFDIAKAFGKGAGTGLGILLLGPIFIMVLAFGNAQYTRNSSPPAYNMKRAA